MIGTHRIATACIVVEVTVASAVAFHRVMQIFRSAQNFALPIHSLALIGYVTLVMQRDVGVESSNRKHEHLQHRL